MARKQASPTDSKSVLKTSAKVSANQGAGKPSKVLAKPALKGASSEKTTSDKAPKPIPAKSKTPGGSAKKSPASRQRAVREVPLVHPLIGDVFAGETQSTESVNSESVSQQAAKANGAIVPNPSPPKSGALNTRSATTAIAGNGHALSKQQSDRSNFSTASELLNPDLIAARAWSIWQREGCPEGRDLEHWLQAEAELRNSPESSR